MSNSEDIYDASCPSQQVLDLVADKWAVLVIAALGDGYTHHGELRRKIKGISKKMLTQTLRKLEGNGLVERKVYPQVPPKVDYLLTPLGEKICVLVDDLCRWAITNLPDMLEARKQYDNKQHAIELDAKAGVS